MGGCISGLRNLLFGFARCLGSTNWSQSQNGGPGFSDRYKVVVEPATIFSCSPLGLNWGIQWCEYKFPQHSFSNFTPNNAD